TFAEAARQARVGSGAPRTHQVQPRQTRFPQQGTANTAQAPGGIVPAQSAEGARTIAQASPVLHRRIPFAPAPKAPQASGLSPSGGRPQPRDQAKPQWIHTLQSVLMP